LRKPLVILIIVLLGSAAHAERTSTITGILGGGASMVSGEFSDLWKLGFNAFLGARIRVAPDLQLVPKVEYHSFSLVQGASPVTGGRLSSLLFGGAAIMEVGSSRSSTRPFGIGGGGFTSVSISAMKSGGESVGRVEETRPYFELGLGLTFRVSPSAQFVIMGRFVSVFFEESTLNYFPLTVAFRL